MRSGDRLYLASYRLTQTVLALTCAAATIGAVGLAFYLVTLWK